MSYAEIYTYTISVYVYVKSLQSCPTLCNPTDCSLPGSSVHGILQARTVEWVAMPSSRGSSQPRDQTSISHLPALAGGFFTTNTIWEAPYSRVCVCVCVHAEWLQSCQTLYNPMDCSLPGSSVHGIFQARVLEWGAIAFSVGQRFDCG